MSPKFKIGDLVKFKEKEFELSSVDGLSVKFDSDKFVGKVTGSIDCGPKGTEYFVDVKIHGVTWNVKVSADQVMSLKDCVCDMMDSIFKKAAIGMREQTAKELSRLVDGLRKGPEISSRIIPTVNPEHNSWIKDMIAKWEKEHPSFDYANVLTDPKRYVMKVDLGFDYAKNPMPKPQKVNTGAVLKMPKDKCIRLLESYRAEREKVRTGRRFERCLRDNVVDEALERAIELLKGCESC